MKRVFSFVLCIVLLIPIVTMINDGNIASALGTINLQVAKADGTFTFVASCANVSDALTAMNNNSSSDAVITNASGTVLAMKRGMAVSAGYLDSNSTLSFIDAYGSRTPYVSNNNVMYFIKSVIYNNQLAATVTISGQTNRAYVKQLRLIPYVFYADGGKFSSTFFLDYYSVNSGNELYHAISTFTEGDASKQFDASEKCTSASVVIDKAPEFMKQGVKYYSNDGMNFYTDKTLKTKAGYHIVYYKYLSYRSKTNYTADELNSYIQYTSKNYGDTSKQSIILNKASAFLNAQNTYGINAAMEISFANLESGYGKSSIATSKNNLFGINAVDSDPSQADCFKSVDECINYHAQNFISWAYCDAGGYAPSGIDMSIYGGGSLTGDSRYYGSVPGNKAVGINVNYASDPFHGEKIAGLMYQLDKKLGFKDYLKYYIGVTNTVTYAYSKPDKNSQILYRLSNRKSSTVPVGMPVIIISQQGDFYKIQSDMPVRYDVQGFTSGLSFYKWNYDLNTAFAYVPKSDITQVIYLTPKAPAALTATGKTNTTIVLSWSPSLGATGYNIYSGTAKLNPSPITTTAYTAAGLTPNTAYSFTVKAVNSFGESDASPVLNATTLTNAPAGLTSPSKTTTSVSLLWNAVTGATGYTVYNGSTKLTPSPVTTTTYLATGLVQSTAYSFTVKAVNASGESAGSQALNVTTLPVAPSNLISSSKTASSVTLAWNPVDRVKSYDIYNGSSKVNSAPILTSTYTVTGLTQNTAYSFTVKAVNTGGESELSKPLNVTTLPSAPASLTAASASYNSIKISWAAVKGATGYAVYRYNTSKKSYDLIKTLASKSYTDTSLVTNTTYLYTIKAFITDSNMKTVYSDYSAPVSCKPIPSVPSSAKAVSASYNSINISWQAVSGATGYVVYRYNPSTKIHESIKVTTALSFKDTNLTCGKEYSYKVKAYRTVGTVKVYSNPTAAFKATPIPSTPASIKSISASYNSIKLSWGTVSGATGYVVYRYNASTKVYDKINTTTAASYTDASRQPGTEYTYKVRAYRKTGTIYIYGSLSAAYKARTLLAVPGSFAAARASSSSIRLSWKAVTGASGYEIYRYLQSANKYELLNTTVSTAYTNTGLKKNVVYSYKVRAYHTANGVKVYGAFTSVKAAKVY